jgi:hypothetical protein
VKRQAGPSRRSYLGRRRHAPRHQLRGGPDVDVAQLIHTEEQRKLLDESGLSRARPDAVIEFTFADGYAQISEILKAHGYDLARRIGGLPEHYAS